MKATLTIEIEFDGEKATADGVAEGIDKVLKVSLEDGWWEDFGKVKIGETLIVLDEQGKTTMNGKDKTLELVKGLEEQAGFEGDKEEALGIIGDMAYAEDFSGEEPGSEVLEN